MDHSSGNGLLLLIIYWLVRWGLGCANRKFWGVVMSRQLSDSVSSRSVGVMTDDGGDLSSDNDEMENASTFAGGLSALKNNADAFSLYGIHISEINPVTGLPMIEGTDLDVAGNFYGDDCSELSPIECDLCDGSDDWYEIDSDII